MKESDYNKQLSLNISYFHLYNLILHYGKNKEAAEELAKEIKVKNPETELLLLSADIRKEEEVNALVEEALSRFSSIEVLVNNAGVTRDQLLLKMTAEDFDCVIESNLRSAFLFSKAVSKQMLKKRYGRIVQISSVVGIHGNSGQSNYAASKAGLIGFSKSLAKELAGRNITVNVIRDGEIVEKRALTLPKEIRNVMRCHNPRCITSIEQGLPHIFYLADEENETYRCKYCDEQYTESDSDFV